MRKKCLILLIFLFINIVCKERDELPITNEEPFYFELEKGCEKIKSFHEIAEGCIKKKEKLLCHQILENTKNSKLDEIFYNQSWESDDTQSYIYKIDRVGNLNVLRGGPDKNKDQYELSGHGKLQRRKGKWYYEHSCERSYCEKIDFDIEFISCFAGYSPDFDSYVLVLTIENSDWFEEDENNRINHKEISFIKFINDKPQIPNGFYSTKVPPIPTK